MKFKRGIALALTFAFAASLGFSQSGSGNNGSGSSSTANGTGTANAQVNMNPGGANFIGAIPGVMSSPGPFPGYAGKNGPCHLVWYPPFRHLTMETVRSMANNNKLNKKQISWTVVDRNAIAVNGDVKNITIADYDPKTIADANDRIEGSVIVPGKYLRTEEELLGVALLKAWEISHAPRYSITECQETETWSHAHTFGVGGVSSGVPGSENIAGSAALGFEFGSNRTARQEHEVIYVLAMNDGSMEAPDSQRPQAPPSQPQQVSPPPRPEAQAQTQTPLPPPPVAIPAPVVAAMPPPVASCNIPQFTVYFDYNKSYVKPEFRDGINVLAIWLENHPACIIQVEGYASKEGSVHYNAGLGFDRSMNVYNLLRADTDPDTQKRVVRALTGGKSFPVSEHLAENRRVIISVRGSASGK